MNNNIKELCETKGLTLGKLIKETGFAKSHIYKIVNGISIPNIKNARKIANALGSTLEEVFPEELEVK